MVCLLDVNGKALPPISSDRAKIYIKRRCAKVVQHSPYTIQLLSERHNTEALLQIYRTVRFICITKEAVYKVRKALSRGQDHCTVEELMRTDGLTGEDNYKGEYSMKEQIAYLQKVVTHVDACLEALKQDTKTAASYEVLQEYYLNPKEKEADQKYKNAKGKKKLEHAIGDLNMILWKS